MRAQTARVARICNTTRWLTIPSWGALPCGSTHRSMRWYGAFGTTYFTQMPDLLPSAPETSLRWVTLSIVQTSRTKSQPELRRYEVFQIEMEGKEVGLLQRSFMNSRRCLGAGLRTLESTGISTFFGGADDPRMLAEDTSFRSTCGHHFALRNLLFFWGGGERVLVMLVTGQKGTWPRW